MNRPFTSLLIVAAGTRRQLATAVLALVCHLLDGCDHPRGRAEVYGKTTLGSQYRRIVFDSLPSAVGPVRITQQPWLELGGLSDADSLEFDQRSMRVEGVELVSGEIVVGDNQRLKFFDRTGRLLRISGRSGSGPGEFTSIRELCPQDDSTVVAIDDDGRWSHWSHSGEHIKTNAREGFIPPHACAPNGQMLIQIEAPGEAIPAPGARRMVATRRVGIDGGVRGEIGSLPAPEYFGQIFYEPGYWLTGQWLLVGDPRTFELERYGAANWKVVEKWRVGGALRTIGDAEWDSLQRSIIPPNSSLTARTRLPRIVNPKVFPGFAAMRVDQDDRIWLSVYFEQRQWLLIDRNGTRLSRLTLPYAAEARPQLAGFVGHGVVIRHVDDDGAVRLSFHRLDEAK